MNSLSILRKLTFLTTLVGCGLYTAAAPVQIKVESPSRLQTLERKARESDRYKTQALELQQTLDAMLSLLPSDEGEVKPDVRKGFGKLSQLLEKASMADALALEVDEVKRELERTVEQRDALQQELDSLRQKQAEAEDILNRFQTQEGEWSEKVAGLRETIERLLLGEFEYYEVKEGDSLQSIAADPLVYGNSSRSTWLRQVNEHRVKRLDHLRVGEVLIIPRFPRNGTYEF